LVNQIFVTIGDTIRVSLASDPVDEVRVGFDILKSLSLRQKGVNLIACPSCSRQKFDVIAGCQFERLVADKQIPS
jgi:4-hydroxy-3-methylbut-2-en-1-yl diphosphate synthase IspG/GcpE